MFEGDVCGCQVDKGWTATAINMARLLYPTIFNTSQVAVAKLFFSSVIKSLD